MSALGPDLEGIAARHTERQAQLKAALKAKLAARNERGAGALAQANGALAYPDQITYNGKSYPITPDTSARLDTEGGTATAQGWVMKTTHDTRQAHVVIENPSYYVEVPVFSGSTAGTDLATSVQNSHYRMASKQAREFVAAVNNAARRRTPEAQARAAEWEAGRQWDEASRQQTVNNLQVEAQRDLAQLDAAEAHGFGKEARAVRRWRRRVKRQIGAFGGYERF